MPATKPAEPAQSTAIQKSTRKGRATRNEAALAEKRQALLAQRSAAIMRMRFEVDCVSKMAEPLREFFSANLQLKGLPDASLQVKVSFSDVILKPGHLGALLVHVTMNWPELEGDQWFSFSDLTEGLLVPRYSQLNFSTQRLSLLPKDGAIDFSIPLKGDRPDSDLVMLCVVAEQERSLRVALTSLKDTQQASMVSQTLTSADASDPDACVLLKEKALKDQIADLERQMEDLREQLRVATEEANKVRVAFRKRETEGSKAILAQLNLAREKLSLRPMKD